MSFQQTSGKKRATNNSGWHERVLTPSYQIGKHGCNQREMIQDSGERKELMIQDREKRIPTLTVFNPLALYLFGNHLKFFLGQ